MANYNTINISKSLYESKRNAYDMGQDGNQSYIISTFAILNNISESKSKFIIHDHLFNKFLESDHSNFDSFLQKEMRYKEDGTMTGANIPQNVRPERPIDDKEEYDESLYYMKEDDEEDDDSDTSEEEKDDDYDIEEDDSDTSEEEDDSLENDSSDNKGQSKLTSVILKFMDDTHLSEASDDEAKLFLSRFKGVLQEVIENEYAIQLIILLLYKAKFEPENLSDGEIEELEDICFSFNNELEESDTSDEDEDEESDTIEESYKYKSLFEVEKNELEKSGKELSRLNRKKANRNKRKQKKQFNKNVSNTRLLKKGIDTVSKDARQGVISKTKEMYNKYPITTCLVGASLLLGAGTIAILGWYALSKYSNKKYNKAKERLITDETKENIINGDTQAIKDNIIDAEIIDRSDTQNSDTSSEETGVNDAPQSTINPEDSGSSDTSLDTNIDSDEEDESDTTDDEEQDIDIDLEDDNTRVELDNDTSSEIQDFDLDIEEIQSNESEIKSELVTQTKEE